MATKDPKFLAQIRNLRCLACGKWPSEAHHIRTRGAGGGDDWWNCIPLCADHHTQNGVGFAWHRGKLEFLKNHPKVLEHLQRLGWSLVGDKLIHDAEAADL